MQTIKQNYLSGKLNKIQAAKLLTAHNGNPFAGNLTVVNRWK